MPIEYLADNMHFAPQLAAWHHAEWRRHYASWTMEQAEAQLRSHMGHCRIPTTFVALEEGCVLGSVSLLEADLDGHEHLSPWLASLFVIPAKRGRGLGKMLVARVVQEASNLGFPALYLWTPGQQAYYERLHWECIAHTLHRDGEIAIMRRTLREAKS
jgi:predicted N-acetyltransferase YhbS